MTDTVTRAGEILATAHNLVTGDRARQHGDAAETYATVARLWSVYLGIAITTAEVLEMLALMKMGRPGNNPDNAVDAAGYMALAGAVRQQEGEQ